MLMQFLSRKPLLEKDSTYCLKGLCMLMIIQHHSMTHGAPMLSSLNFFLIFTDGDLSGQGCSSSFRAMAFTARLVERKA